MIILKDVFMDLEKKFSNLTTYNIDNMKTIIEILHHIMIKIVVTRLEDVFLLTLKGKLSILTPYDIDYNDC